MSAIKYSGGSRFWILFLLTVVLLAACGKPAKEDALISGSTVLALGDSLTAGVGVNAEQAWPALLAKQTGWDVINGGVSGDKSGDALKRLPALLEEHEPVLVLVALGGNDMLHHVPEQETIANLEQMLSLVKGRGARVVLLATPKPSVAGAVFRNLSAPDFYRTVADKNSVPLLEDAIADVLSQPQLKGDPLHPNAEGHAILAGKVLGAMRSLGYAR